MTGTTIHCGICGGTGPDLKAPFPDSGQGMRKPAPVPAELAGPLSEACGIENVLKTVRMNHGVQVGFSNSAGWLNLQGQPFVLPEIGKPHVFVEQTLVRVGDKHPPQILGTFLCYSTLEAATAHFLLRIGTELKGNVNSPADLDRGLASIAKRVMPFSMFAEDKFLAVIDATSSREQIGIALHDSPPAAAVRLFARKMKLEGAA